MVIDMGFWREVVPDGPVYSEKGGPKFTLTYLKGEIRTELDRVLGWFKGFFDLNTAESVVY